MSPGVCHRTVIKLGGSLLDWPDLVPRLRSWLASRRDSQDLLIVGGGKLVDALRESERLHGLPPELAHWQAVRLMSVQTALVRAWLDDMVQMTSVMPFLKLANAPGHWLVDPWTFMQDEEPRLSVEPLPARWDVTSDSISARLATLVEASELVLLKSALPDAGCDGQQLAATGYVDAFFPVACHGVPNVRCVNLRDGTETVLRMARRSEVGH